MDRMATNTDHITADQLTDLRDTQQQSWAKVAAALDLGSPGAARRAYSKLVRPHTESVLHTTARSKSGLPPVDLTDLTLTDVRDAIAGKTITVERKNGTERISVAKVTSVKNGTINFNDPDGKRRSVKASAVVAAR